MTTLKNKARSPAARLAKLWQRTPVLVKAILMITLIGIVGANGISVFLISLPIIILQTISEDLFLGSTKVSFTYNRIREILY